MNYVFILFFNLVLVTQLLGQTSSPTNYMNVIGEHYALIKNDTWNYMTTVAHNNGSNDVEKKRLELLNTISNTKKTVAALPAFEGDNSYKESVVNYLAINYDVLNNDYARLVDMEKIAEQSYDLMETYLLAQSMASKRLKLAATNLQSSQQDFANKFDIKLQDDGEEIALKLEEIDKMYKYYNTIYLIFFKAYKQEAYLVDAYSKADISAMEQNKNQLLDYSKAGLSELSNMPAYKGDQTLRDKAIKTLLFYQEEAEKHAPKQIDFYLKKERFENVKKALDAKPKETRSKEDVDKYNNSLTDYNTSLATFNEINNLLNGQRSDIYNSWSKTCQEFTANHVENN